MHGKKPTVKYFKVFGKEVFALDKRPGKGKFEEKCKKYIFVGYSETSKAYRLWSPKERKVIVSRDVKFLDNF